MKLAAMQNYKEVGGVHLSPISTSPQCVYFIKCVCVGGGGNKEVEQG